MMLPFVSLLLFATTSPLSVVPEISEVPVDVSKHEEAGALLTNFTLLNAERSPREATRLVLSYSRTHLYVSGEATSFALDPTSNMAERFKATARQRDAGMEEDESVEFIFHLGNEKRYSLTINPLGTLRDARLSPDGSLGWDADVVSSASMHDGYWRFRMAIAWDSLGYRPTEKGAPLALEVLRHDSNTGERSLLAKRPVQLRFAGQPSKSSAYGHLMPLALPLTSSHTIPARIFAAEGSTVAWKREVLSKGVVTGEESQSLVIQTSPADLQLPPPSERKAGGEQERVSLLVNGHLIYQSPAYPFRDDRTTVKIEVPEGAPAFTLLCNGQSVIRHSHPVREASISIHPGANAFTLETEADSPPELRLTPPAGAPPITLATASWVLAEKNGGKNVYRFLLAFDASRLSPHYGGGVCEIAAGAAQYFQWDGGGLSQWDLPEALVDYRLVLDLPAHLELIGASGTSGAALDSYHWEKQGTIYHGTAPYQRYALFRKAPVHLAAGKEEWLKREKRQAQGLTFAIASQRENSEIGDTSIIYYGMEALTEESGTPIVEIANALPVRIVSPLEGKPPSSITFSLYSRHGVVADKRLQKRLFETLHAAGVNEVFTQTTSQHPRKIGLRQSTFFGLGHSSWIGFRAGTLRLDALLERHPEAHAIAFDGRKMPTPCLSWLARHEEATPYLQEALEEQLKKHPGMSHLFWDYEFPPFPEGIHAYPMFSDFGIAAFREAYAIETPLTPEIIRERHADEWVAFTCGEVAAVVQKLSRLAKAAGAGFTMYSGYHLPYTQRRYNVDWAKLAPALDRAYCGYSRDAKLIASTQAALGNVPLVGGLLAMGPSAPRPTLASIIRTLAQHRGGVLFWYEGGGFDSGTLLPIAQASQLIAGYEETILNGEDALEQLSMPPALQGSVFALRRGASVLLFLVNEGSAPKTLAIPLPEEFRASHRLSGSVEPLSPALSRELAAGEAVIIPLEVNRHE